MVLQDKYLVMNREYPVVRLRAIGPNRKLIHCNYLLIESMVPFGKVPEIAVFCNLKVMLGLTSIET